MPVNPVTWATSNVPLVITALLALVALAWAYEAYDEADDGKEALQGFGSRAKSGTGGALNLVLVGVVTVVGWMSTTFMTVGEAGAYLLSLVPDFPMLTASALTISLGAIGLSDLIVLQWSHFVLVATAVVLIALAYRTDFGGVLR